MKNILVTGADGFIGQALSLRLAKDGFIVRGQIYDTSNSAFKAKADKNNIELFATGDLRVFSQWSKLFANAEAIIHLAAKVHDLSKNQQQNLAEYRAVNTTLTGQIAREAVNAGIKKMIFISTAKVNGESTPAGCSFKETDEPQPQDAYAQSKCEAEEVLRKISAESGLPTVIVRLPLVYGPGVKANFLRLLKFIDKGIPLPLNSVANKRSLIYLGNLIDALTQCINNDQAVNQTFLVSDDHDISTPDLLSMIAASLKKKTHLISVPIGILSKLGKVVGKAGEVERLTGSLVIDITKIKATLGWRPPFSLEVGIKETVAWYKSPPHLTSPTRGEE